MLTIDQTQPELAVHSKPLKLGGANYTVVLVVRE
jgi:hypothetical protein